MHNEWRRKKSDEREVKIKERERDGGGGKSFIVNKFHRSLTKDLIKL
jgi:hypothetical protein